MYAVWRELSECRRESVLGTRWLELHETRAMKRVSATNGPPYCTAIVPRNGSLPFTCQTTPSRATEPSDVSVGDSVRLIEVCRKTGCADWNLHNLEVWRVKKDRRGQRERARQAFSAPRISTLNTIHISKSTTNSSNERRRRHQPRRRGRHRCTAISPHRHPRHQPSRLESPLIQPTSSQSPCQPTRLPQRPPGNQPGQPGRRTSKPCRASRMAIPNAVQTSSSLRWRHRHVQRRPSPTLRRRQQIPTLRRRRTRHNHQPPSPTSNNNPL